MANDGIQAPREGRCLICGQPLGATEGYWVTDPPDGEHDRCRDWSQVAFPYEHELEALRALARSYLRGYRAVVRVGRDLAAVRQAWPAGGSAALAAYRKQKAALVKTLERLRRPAGW